MTLEPPVGSRLAMWGSCAKGQSLRRCVICRTPRSTARAAHRGRHARNALRGTRHVYYDNTAAASRVRLDPTSQSESHDDCIITVHLSLAAYKAPTACLVFAVQSARRFRLCYVRWERHGLRDVSFCSWVSGFMSVAMNSVFLAWYLSLCPVHDRGPRLVYGFSKLCCGDLQLFSGSTRDRYLVDVTVSDCRSSCFCCSVL